MKKCVCCGRETYHKVGVQTVCAQCDVDGSFEYHLKQQAAQQSVQADICYESASSNHIWQPLKFGEVCIACGKCR